MLGIYYRTTSFLLFFFFLNMCIYYETIAGGAGAGPTWHGTSAVQVHMTNTRITDAEILERRYRVLLKEYSVRHDSGGKGEFNGGDGVVRELEFLKPYTIGILSERRSFGMILNNLRLQ